MDLYLASSMSSPKPGTLDTLFLISAYTNASKNFNVSLYIKSEKAMAPHSRTLAWKIPWTEDPGGVVHGVAKSQTRLSDFTFTFHFHALEKEMASHSSVLAWRIPGTGGAWWAAVYGVAQSWTRLKRLSRSLLTHLVINTWVISSLELLF